MKITSLAMVMAILPTTSFADSARIIGQYGSWVVFAATDQMTDNTWYGARTPNDGDNYVQVSCEWQRLANLNVSFNTKEFLGDGFRDAVYRVDSKAAHTITGSYSAHHVFSLCDGACKGDGQSHPEVTWAATTKEGTNLLVRLKTYRNEDVNLSFRTDGAGEAFKQVLAGCAKLAADKKNRKP